jgi:hypothetical protein
VIASDGTAVDVMFLPPNASARHSTLAKMRDYMVDVYEIEPSKYSAIRSAFTGCPDRVPELDGWLGDKSFGRSSSLVYMYGYRSRRPSPPAQVVRGGG